jgi:hypothetical protein
VASRDFSDFEIRLEKALGSGLQRPTLRLERNQAKLAAIIGGGRTHQVATSGFGSTPRKNVRVRPWACNAEVRGLRNPNLSTVPPPRTTKAWVPIVAA